MSAHWIYSRISPQFRRRRMRRFRILLQPAAGDTVLDVGGTAAFWSEQELPLKVTLLNPDAAVATGGTMTAVQGDGCALPFADGTFAIAFSNSAIEHVGTWARQQAFAGEIRRVATKLWVQTPAREFFIEPHLITPFIHWLPRRWQRRLMRHCTVRGWLDRPDARAVEAFLDEVRLLTFAEMKLLFPDCTILRERFLGLTKSYIAVRPPS